MSKNIFLETDRVYTVLRSSDPVARAEDELAREAHLMRESFPMALTAAFVRVLAEAPLGGDTVELYRSLTRLADAVSYWQAAISDSWLDSQGVSDHEGSPVDEGG